MLQLNSHSHNNRLLLVQKKHTPEIELYYCTVLYIPVCWSWGIVDLGCTPGRMFCTKYHSRSRMSMTSMYEIPRIMEIDRNDRYGAPLLTMNPKNLLLLYMGLQGASRTFELTLAESTQLQQQAGVHTVCTVRGRCDKIRSTKFSTVGMCQCVSFVTNMKFMFRLVVPVPSIKLQQTLGMSRKLQRWNKCSTMRLRSTKTCVREIAN